MWLHRVGKVKNKDEHFCAAQISSVFLNLFYYQLLTLNLHESYLRVLGQEDRIIRKQAIRYLLCLGRIQVPKEEDTFKEGGNSLLSLTCKSFHNLTPVLIPSLICAPVSGVFWVLIKSAPAGFPLGSCLQVFFSMLFCLLYFSYLETQALTYTLMENDLSFKMLVAFYPPVSVNCIYISVPHTPPNKSSMKIQALQWDTKQYQ